MWGLEVMTDVDLQKFFRYYFIQNLLKEVIDKVLKRKKTINVIGTKNKGTIKLINNNESNRYKK